MGDAWLTTALALEYHRSLASRKVKTSGGRVVVSAAGVTSLRWVQFPSLTCSFNLLDAKRQGIFDADEVIMKDKIAYHLQKDDILMGPKGQKAKVETVIKKNNDRDIEVTVRLPEGKKLLRFGWREDVRLWAPPSKRRRYAFLFWLAKKLNAPIKRV